jgi:hypothetical protein
MAAQTPLQSLPPPPPASPLPQAGTAAAAKSVIAEPNQKSVLMIAPGIC